MGGEFAYSNGGGLAALKVGQAVAGTAECLYLSVSFVFCFCAMWSARPSLRLCCSPLFVGNACVFATVALFPHIFRLDSIVIFLHFWSCACGCLSCVCGLCLRS